MRGYDKSPVTPDLIGGPCLPPSTAMDTHMRGYDLWGHRYDHHLSLWIRSAIHSDQQRHHEQEEMTFS